MKLNTMGLCFTYPSLHATPSFFQAVHGEATIFCACSFVDGNSSNRLSMDSFFPLCPDHSIPNCFSKFWFWLRCLKNSSSATVNTKALLQSPHHGDVRHVEPFNIIAKSCAPVGRQQLRELSQASIRSDVVLLLLVYSGRGRCKVAQSLTSEWEDSQSICDHSVNTADINGTFRFIFFKSPITQILNF